MAKESASTSAKKPYLPLFVDDFLSDEKLSMCSAEAYGVYIVLMCLMHKSDEYGVILLKQKLKQNPKQIKNFACQLARQMPFEIEVIERGLQELIDEGVVTLDGDRLFQKRMVRDGKIRYSRALAGSKGGRSTQKKIQKSLYNTNVNNYEFALANAKANCGMESINSNNQFSNDLGGTEGNEEITVARAKSLSDVMTLFLDRINPAPSPSCIEWLKSYTEDMGGDVVCRAIEIAIDEKAASWSYIKAILQNWTQKKVKSLADVDKLEAERKRAKADGSKKKYVTAAEAQGNKKPPTPQEVEQMKKFLEKLKEE